MSFQRSNISSMRGMVIWAIVLGCSLTGCGSGVAPAGFARDQPLRGGSVDVAWQDRAARCTVVTAFTRISCRAMIRRLPGGSVRVALIADEGVLLADLTSDGTTTTVTKAIPDLASTAARLGWFVHQAWGEQHTAGQLQAVGQPQWHDGHWRTAAPSTTAPDAQRLYGGDPLLLRRIEAQSADLNVGDYRPWGNGLLAYRSDMSALGFSVTLMLGDPQP